MNLVLGYVGLAYSGKDTTNNMVVQQAVGMTAPVNKDAETGVTFRTFVPGAGKSMFLFHVPLALEVKREYVAEQAAAGVTVSLDDLLYNPQIKAQHREGLIAIGDGRRETVDPFYWLKKVEAIIADLSARYGNATHRIFSITDMRYENELPYMEQSCYALNVPIISVKLTTSLATVLSRMTRQQASDYAIRYKNNPSERNVKRVHADIEINNDGTELELLAHVQKKIIPVMSLITV